jgi:hypothetical protein
MKFWTDFHPAAGALAVLVLFLAVSATAQTNTLSDAEIQGRQLAQQLCDARPTESFTNTGVLKIRNANGVKSEIPIKIETIVTTTNWSSTYELSPADIVSKTITPKRLVVLHDPSNSNQYRLTFSSGDQQWTKERSDIVAILGFAGDFSVADLGLEFFHWPQQKVLPKTTNLKRGRDYTLLESTNPNSPDDKTVPPIRYSRVVSWIDKETGGILEAEAYDAQNKLLKVFEPKSFKKVNGQWELQEMEIRNVQTGSRTRLEFDLKK